MRRGIGRMGRRLLGRAGGEGGGPPLMDFDGGIFTRDSVSTFHHGLPSHVPGELLTRYGIDERRKRPGGGIYLEGARTNLIPDSADAANYSNGINTPAQATDPAGLALGAGQFVALAASSSEAYAFASPESVADNTLHTSSAFGERVGAWEGVLPGVSARNKAGGFTVAIPFDDIPGWQRRGVTFDSLTGAVSPRASVLQAATALPWTCNNWGYQLEEGAFSSSLIETSDAEATREGDRFTIPVAEVDPAFFTGPYRQRCVPGFDKGPGGYYISAAGSWVVYFHGMTGNVSLFKGIELASIDVAYSAGDTLDIWVDWAGGKFRVVSASGDVSATFASPGPPPPADVSIGTNVAGGSPYFGAMYPPVAISSV